MNSVEREMHEELARRLHLLDEAEVLMFAGIPPLDLEKARISGALKFISTYDGRRYYEESEVLRWLKGRHV